MERNFEFSETESRLAFAALCVECAAKRLVVQPEICTDE